MGDKELELTKNRAALEQYGYTFPVSVDIQMRAIPDGSEYHANRYDNDVEYVLHIWDDKGNSYDIRVAK